MSKRDNMLPLTLQFQVCIYSYQTKILASNPRWERHGFFFFFWNISRSVAYFINREGSQGSNKICKYIWGLKGKKYRSFILAKVKTKNSSNYIIWLWRCRVQFFWRKNETRFMDGSKKKSGMEVGHKGIKCHLVTAMKSQCLCQILWWIGGIQLAQWQFKVQYTSARLLGRWTTFTTCQLRTGRPFFPFHQIQYLKPFFLLICGGPRDPRRQFNYLQSCVASAKLTGRCALASFGGTPLMVRKYILDECRKWNLFWVGTNKVAPLQHDGQNSCWELGYARSAQSNFHMWIWH